MAFIGAMPIILFGLWCLVMPDVILEFYVWLRGKPIPETRLLKPSVLRVLGLACLVVVTVGLWPGDLG
jgi:hypothetical protein